MELHREAHVQADNEMAQVRREMHDQLVAAPQAVPKSGPRSAPHLNGIARDRDLPEPYTSSTGICSP